MLDDLDLICREFDEKEINIYPIYDVHYGSIHDNPNAFKDLINTVLDDKNGYVVLGGDLCNNSTKLAKVGTPWDDYVSPFHQKSDMVEFLRPIKSRIIAAVEGNHESRNAGTGQSMTYDIMAKLDLEELFRPNAAFIYIQLGKRSNGKDSMRSVQSFKVACTHGAGGGSLTGSSVNKNERWGSWMDADLVMVGHTHKGAITRPNRLVIDDVRKKARVVPYTVVSVPSMQQYGGYAVNHMLQPSDSGSFVKITLKANPRDKKVEVQWL